jgi:hypothetical protein
MAAPKGNKNAIGNEGGRPSLYTDPAELSKNIEAYFKDNNKITICGLAYHLGFVSRQSLSDYENRIEFSDIIKRAKLRVEMSYEEKLSEGNCAGSIFALKNMEWSDKSEVNNNTNLTITNLDGMSTSDLKKLEELLSKANGR